MDGVWDCHVVMRMHCCYRDDDDGGGGVMMIKRVL